MATKNQKIHKASWIGVKIDIWSGIARLTDMINRFATVKAYDYTEVQEELLEEIESERSSISSEDAV